MLYPEYKYHLSYETMRKHKLSVRAIKNRDNNTCVYCLRSDVPMTLDHIVPQCRGGSNLPTNLVSACRSCNSSKNKTALADWTSPEIVERVMLWVQRDLQSI